MIEGATPRKARRLEHRFSCATPPAANHHWRQRDGAGRARQSVACWPETELDVKIVHVSFRAYIATAVHKRPSQYQSRRPKPVQTHQHNYFYDDLSLPQLRSVLLPGHFLLLLCVGGSDPVAVRVLLADREASDAEVVGARGGRGVSSSGRRQRVEEPALHGGDDGRDEVQPDAEGHEQRDSDEDVPSELGRVKDWLAEDYSARPKEATATEDSHIEDALRVGVERADGRPEHERVPVRKGHLGDVGKDELPDL